MAKKEEMGNVPNLRFEGFEGAWKESTLNMLCDKIGDGLHGTPNYTHGTGYYFINGNNLLNGEVNITKDTKEVTQEDWYRNNKNLNDNTLFVSINGTIGNVSKFNGINLMLGKSVAYLKFKEKRDFFYFTLCSPNVQKYFTSELTGTTIKNLSLKTIRDTKVFYPFPNEQNKISELLGQINLRIVTQSKIIDNLQSQIKELAKKIFSQQINLKDDDGINFSEWENRFGNEIFNNISNKNHNSDLPILAITQEHGAIPRNLIEYQISVTEKSIESYKVVEVGDFIISLRSFQGGIEYSNYKGICSPAYIILKAKIDIDNRFYKYYLKTENYIKSLNEKLEGIRDGKMISYKYFSDICLPYPSLKEQNKISDMFSIFEQKVELEKQLLLKYENQKKYLLQNLFI